MTPKGCTVCKGRGVVSQFLWKVAIPEEMKRMRERSTRRIGQLCKRSEETSKTPKKTPVNDDLSGASHCDTNDGVEDVVI